MTFFEFLRKELGNSGRRDFYFEGGRVEIHAIENSSAIFVRIAKEVIPEKDFVAIDFIPEREYWVTGISREDEDLKKLIKNSQRKLSYP